MKNIPKILHFFWFKESEPEITYIEKYQKMYEGFEFKIWRREDFNSETDEGDELLMQDTNSFTKYAFDNDELKSLEDYFKLKVLYEQGGIYVDLDMEPKWPLDFDNDCEVYLAYQHMNKITSSLIVTAPEHRLIKSLLDYYDSLVNTTYLPSLDSVITEITYSHYPNIGFKDDETKIDDLHILSRKEARNRWFSKKNQPYFVHRKDKGNFIMNKLASYFSWIELATFGLDSYKAAHELKTKTTEGTVMLPRPIRTITVTKDLKFMIKPLFEEIVDTQQQVRVHLHFKNDILKETFEKIHYVSEVTFGSETTKQEYDDLEINSIENINIELPEEVAIKFEKTNKRFNFESQTNIYSRIFNSGVKGIVYMEELPTVEEVNIEGPVVEEEE